ncbi:MAG: sulfotransferase family protein [Pseudomonadota bacterium]
MMSVVLKLRRWAGRPRLLKQLQPVIIEDETACEDPVFLIGCHRSGTSLVRRIFNAHHDIACPPETYFLENYVEMLQSDLVASGYLGFGYDKEAMRSELRTQARRMHEAFRLAEGKRRWADKTPQYTAIISGLRDLFGPKARFVMIYRHPFDVVTSIQEKGWCFLSDEGDFFLNTVKYVAGMQGRMLSFERENPEICTRLAYEALTAQPEKELRRVLDFLGETFDPNMLRFNEQRHNFGIEDLVVRSQNGFVFSGGRWRLRWSREAYDQACAELGQIAAELGYGLPSWEAARSMD